MQYPWFVSLRKFDPAVISALGWQYTPLNPPPLFNISHTCGGMLLANDPRTIANAGTVSGGLYKYVLTAAHCVPAVVAGDPLRLNRENVLVCVVVHAGRCALVQSNVPGRGRVISCYLLCTQLPGAYWRVEGGHGRPRLEHRADEASGERRAKQDCMQRTAMHQ